MYLRRCGLDSYGVGFVVKELSKCVASSTEGLVGVAVMQ